MASSRLRLSACRLGLRLLRPSFFECFGRCLPSVCGENPWNVYKNVITRTPCSKQTFSDFFVARVVLRWASCYVTRERRRSHNSGDAFTALQFSSRESINLLCDQNDEFWWMKGSRCYFDNIVPNFLRHGYASITKKSLIIRPAYL